MIGTHGKLVDPGYRKVPLLREIKQMVASLLYGSDTSRGVLEQERYFFGHVNSPEHMMTHRVLADDQLYNMQEGTSMATDDGGDAGTYTAITG